MIKYSTSNIFNVKRSLGYFDDVPKGSWDEVNINDQSITLKNVKKAILNAISEYNSSCLKTLVSK